MQVVAKEVAYQLFWWKIQSNKHKSKRRGSDIELLLPSPEARDCDDNQTTVNCGFVG